MGVLGILPLFDVDISNFGGDSVCEIGHKESTLQIKE